MPATPRLPLKLYERLGDDAMTELLALFGEETRAAFQDLHEADTRLEARVQGLAAQIADLKQEVGDLRHQVGDLKQQIADLKPHIVAVQSELIKWTFLFWLGTIGIVLLLLRFPP
jgi:chaperonin cofactor prefoldin